MTKFRIPSLLLRVVEFMQNAKNSQLSKAQLTPRVTISEKPTYEELEQRVLELEKALSEFIAIPHTPTLTDKGNGSMLAFHQGCAHITSLK